MKCENNYRFNRKINEKTMSLRKRYLQYKYRRNIQQNDSKLMSIIDSFGFISGPQLFIARVQKNIVLLLWVIVFVTLRPVITDGIREQLSPSTETTLSNWLFQLFRRLELSSGVFVPEAEASIRSDSGESAMVRVKRNVIYCEYVLKSIIGSVRSMTFKREVVLRVDWVHVLNGNPSLNATQSKTRWRRRVLLFVEKYGDTPVLILQGRLQSFVLLQTLFQRVDNYSSISGSDDSHRVKDVSAIDPLREIDCHSRLIRSQIP